MLKTNIKFDYDHINELYKANKNDEAEVYLKKFFFRNGTQIFCFDGIKFQLRDQKEALKLIPDDLYYKVGREKITAKSFFTSTDFLKVEYEPTIDFQKPLIFTKPKRIQGKEFDINYLNCAKPMNEDILMTPEELNMARNDPIATEKLKRIYDHFFKVLSNSDENSYKYQLNFYACSIAGKKLRVALYYQSEERTGKGIIINMINNILADRMLKTNSVETVTKYTKPFEGVSIVNLDELPHTDNFKGLQDSLKGLITEPTFTCRDMYSTGYTQINSFNIIITTNNNAISLTQNNKERYIICEIDESYKGNTKYFKELSDAVNDPIVKSLFYYDMMDRFKTLKNWNEDIQPETKAKRTKIIEALPLLYKYLKENYILTNTDLNVKTDIFLNDYQRLTNDRSSKQALGKLLHKINIKPLKLSNNAGYKYAKSCDELLEEFNKNKWMDNDNDVINPKFSNSKFDVGIYDDDDEQEFDYKLLYSNLRKENEDLKKQNEELKMKLKSLEPAKIAAKAKTAKK